MTREEYNRISGLIVDTSVKVHQKLGPGLLESVYRKALAYELRKIGLKADEEVPFKCLLINFGYPIVTKSIRRMVNNF